MNISTETRSDSPSRAKYTDLLYRLYTEYAADRKALNIVENIVTENNEKKNAVVESQVNGFIDTINAPIYVNNLTYLISYFRFHRNAEKFILHTMTNVMHVANALVHLYAWSDHYPVLRDRLADVSESKFVNGNVDTLMEFFRNSYEADTFDITDGLDLIESFLLNFGIKLIDTEKGLSCEVSD